jgi:hypothetical protein
LLRPLPHNIYIAASIAPYHILLRQLPHIIYIAASIAPYYIYCCVHCPILYRFAPIHVLACQHAWHRRSIAGSQVLWLFLNCVLFYLLERVYYLAPMCDSVISTEQSLMFTSGH